MGDGRTVDVTGRSRTINLESTVRYYHHLEGEFEAGDVLVLDGRSEVIWTIERGRITTVHRSGKKMMRNYYIQSIDDDGKYLEYQGEKK